MSESIDNQSGVGNSRWWESYLVRYFSGFLVGALCVSAFAAYIAFLTAGEGQVVRVLTTLLNKDAPTIAILITIGILGLVYSYLVSAPITVIHYGRGVRIFWDAQSRPFWFAWVILLILTATDILGIPFRVPAILSIILISIPLFYLLYGYWRVEIRTQPDTPTPTFWRLLELTGSILAWVMVVTFTLQLIINLMPRINKWQFYLLVFSLPAIWVGLSQYITVFKILLVEKEVHQFYQRLTKARSTEGSKDIRESYTHLREHSNSTFIVILELCFFCLIILIASLNIKSQQTLAVFLDVNGDGVRLGTWLFCIFMIWSIPNLFLWSRANGLERSFADAPHIYLRERE